MKRYLVLVSAFLALMITVNPSFALDDKPGRTSRNGGKLHRAGDKICYGLEIAVDKTGKALEKAGNKTGQALGIAADKTTLALEKAGKKIQGWFE